MSKVSVIIPTFNSARFIRSCIESVLNQSYQDFEIIIIDDGSTDNTSDILKSFSDGRLKYFYKANGGASSARNYGMARALGDYIAFLDADDIWLPAKLEDQINLLEEYKDFGIVSCNFQHMDPSGEDGCLINMRRIFPEDGFNLYSMLRHSLLVTSSIVIRKMVVDDVGYFNSDYDGAEDIDYFLRILTKYPLIVADKFLFKYRTGHPSYSRRLHCYIVRERVLNDFFKRIDKSDVNLGLAKTDAYYGLYYNHGKDLLWYGKPKEAREYFIKALRYKKAVDVFCLYLKSYLKEALTFLGFLKVRTG